MLSRVISWTARAESSPWHRMSHAPSLRFVLCPPTHILHIHITYGARPALLVEGCSAHVGIARGACGVSLAVPSEPPARPPPLRLHSFMHVLYLYHRLHLSAPPEAYSIHETVRPGRTGPVLKGDWNAFQFVLSDVVLGCLAVACAVMIIHMISHPSARSLRVGVSRTLSSHALARHLMDGASRVVAMASHVARAIAAIRFVSMRW